MRYVQPILFVAGDNEMETLIHAKETYREDFDILIPYEYQRRHYKLLLNYVAPDYYNMCPVKPLLKDTLKDIDKSPYGDYFKYFLISFLKQSNWSPEDFTDWLNQPHHLYFKEHNIKILRFYELKTYYQTVVIDLNLKNGNRWNRMWDLPPNIFNVITVNTILHHLSEGGRLYFTNTERNWDKIFDYTRYGFDQIEEDLYIRKITPKMNFKIPRKWL